MLLTKDMMLLIIVFQTLRYLQQFKDLYTEEGRKSVKICNFIPGQHASQSATHHSVLANQGPPQATHNALQIETNVPENSENDTSTSGHTNASLPTFTSSNLSSQASVLPSSNLSSLQTYGQKLAAFQQQQHQQQSSVGSASQTVTAGVGSSSVLTGTKTTQSLSRKGLY
jgi:hypothetical protein